MRTWVRKTRSTTSNSSARRFSRRSRTEVSPGCGDLGHNGAAMAITAGTRFGPYEILGAIGAGGMGEVYKATDTRLNRTVAIKVLPPHFAGDADMKQRFDREAQTIAGLNHPHICTLHDVGEQDGVSFLVMEHIEGETLAARISRGALPIDDALKVAGEIIDALDKAHRQNIVHRDLKPANIMLTKGGTKLLDFGLAKWAASGQSGSHGAQETRMDVTAQGTMIGTMQYMSPEQVEGREADTRTDLFGFGAVLYEMLTGKKVFEGKTQASLIGAIMKAEPRPVSHLAQMTPPVLDHVVSRCLAKDPDDRWQTAHDLMIQLAWISRSRTDTTVSPAIAEAERKSQRLTMILTASALAVAAALAAPAYFYLQGPAEPEAIQFRHTIIGLSAPDISISPDGRLIAFVAKPDTAGSTSLYVRPVGSVTARKIAGTDNASQPFWSPDSASIGYLTSGRLKKVAAAGGASEDIAEAKDFFGGAWSAAGDGTILFGTAKGLSRVSAEGGPATVMTEPGQGETGHLWPSFLPDGTHYTYLAWSEDAASRAIYVAALDTKDRQRLIAEESNAVYAASTGSTGHLFFHRGPTLFAQPFNAKKLAFTGEPAQVAGGMATGQTGRGLFDVSQTGALIYFQGASDGGVSGVGRIASAQFGFVDRSGSAMEIGVAVGDLGDMDLSPSGALIAVTKQETGSRSSDIWVVDWRQTKQTRLTTDASDDVNPVWALPTGRQIAFTTWRKGNADIYIKNANNVGDETPLIQTPMNESIEDWSKDGKFIVFGCGQDEFQDICAAPIDPDGKPGKPFTVVTGRHHKNEPQFSYDGKWLAYTSDINAPGTFEVFVQSFPGGDIKLQISREGGGQPRWRRDGKELYFRALDLRLMAVDIALGARIEPGVPHQLFTSSTAHLTALDPIRHMWAALPDGQRFLTRINPAFRANAGAAGTGRDVAREFTPPGQSGARTGGPGAYSSGLTVLLHWPSALPKEGK
ncbi:MAG: serine/threonine-protein kinase [Acidobacteria bacterium]|nr:serine/threonine-protein kinase [Acidobacteriota bacterium]